MKPRVMFTVADNNNLKWAKQLENTLRKFHSAEEIPFVIIGQEELDKWDDKAKFYRATPYYAKKFLEEYELVIKIDADSLITGTLDYIFQMSYDVATVYNWNRVDPPVYGEIGLATIRPLEYYNNGLVAMRSKEFVNQWLKLCYGPHFDRMPFREQGFLNVLAHYGEFKVLCLDDYFPVFGYSAWHGLRSKGEWNKIELRNKELLLPKGDNGYPEMDKVIKVIHWAGGQD